MDVLTAGGQISGPYTYSYLASNSCDVYLFGEEHTNQHQCTEGHDVVDVLRALVKEGVDVYVEMPTHYKSKFDASELLCRKSSTSQPRTKLLNDLRTCMYILQRQGYQNVHFVDPRQHFGPITFSDEETAFIDEMKRHPDSHALTQRLIRPLQKAEEKICDTLQPELHIIWHDLVFDKLSRLNCAIRRRSLDTALDIFHKATDSIMNVYTVNLLLERCQQANPKSRSLHVIYAGSAHCQDIETILTSMKFRCVQHYAGTTNKSCVQLQPRALLPH